MNHQNQAILQRLIVDLGDTGKLYTRLSRALDSVYAKEVVERMVLAHRAIAADLVEHMATMGVHTVRSSSMVGKFRVYWTVTRSTTGANPESGCLAQIQCHEAQIVKRFHEAADHLAGMTQRMHHHVATLEDVSAPVISMLNQTQRERQARADMRPSRSSARTIAPFSAEGLLVMHDSNAMLRTRHVAQARGLR